MKRWLLTAALLLTVGGVSAQKVERIVLPAKATEAECYAAAELQRFLAQGGLTLDTVREDGKSGEFSTLAVGRTRLAERYATLCDSLHDDGFLLAGDGHTLCLLGTGEKGTLYAVYAFLEQLGFRLYTPDALVVPDLSDFRIPTSKIVENPAFEYREVLYYYPNQSQLYADWHRLHNRADLHRHWGMFVHTFKDLIPTKVYFEQYPEWFSLNNGRRSRDGQLCLSNAEVLEELCRRLADTMAALPEKRIWSVSPNDNYNACQCPNCRHLDSLYGGQSGTLLWFVNQVARRFPDKVISTLAYQYTRQAPTAIRPDSNVIVMLCPIEVGREKPIATNDFAKDMEDWANLCFNDELRISNYEKAAATTSNFKIQNSKLFLWDYVVQFRNFWNPFPNLHVLQPNLQFFRRNGTRMMFEQATGAENITSWMDIRCYMIAKLLWNPDIDIDSVMADFYHGYYGAAGRYVKEIIDTMTAALVASGQRLDIYGFSIDGADSYLTVERLDFYDSLMNRAYAGADSVVRHRLDFFNLALQYARVELAASADLRGYTGVDDDLVGAAQSLSDRLYQLYKGLSAFGVSQMMEMGIGPREYYGVMVRYIDKLGWDNKAYLRNVVLRKKPTRPYECDGAQTLTDGEGGIMDYRHKWLGFWGDTLDAVIDLGDSVEVGSVSIDFFFYPLSWIFLPKKIELLTSDDGEHWQLVDVLYPNNPEVLARPEIKTFGWTLPTPRRARYIRIVAEPLPEIPAWHRAAGQKAWIFTDEVIVK